MRRINFLLYLLIAAVPFVLEASCNTAKKTAATTVNKPLHSAENISADSLYNNIAANNINFNTFSAQAKVDFSNANTDRQGINAVIRIQKDSIIWVSVTALLGIEVARAEITQDSLKVINRLRKQVILKKIADLKDLINIPFDFNTLQNLLVGNPVFFSDSISDIKRNSLIISFISQASGYTNQMSVTAGDYLTKTSLLKEKDTTVRRSAQLAYGDYAAVNGMQFSNSRGVVVNNSGKETHIAIAYSHVDFNQPLNFPFQVNNKYEVK